MTRRRWWRACLLLVALSAWIGVAAVWARQVPDAAQPGGELVGEGWRGFSDYAFLGQALLALLLATVLGAAIAYHPRRYHTADSLAEADAPKVFVLYAVIGAMIGIMVLKYGLVVGFVIFGIGGLTRFRSDLASAPDTGRLIFVTLTGLSCGLDLPHLAVLATAFGFVLLTVLDANVTYHIDVKGLERGVLGQAADAYRGVLVREGCRVLNERKSFSKEQATFIFRAPRGLRREVLAQRLETGVPPELRGAVDWEVD